MWSGGYAVETNIGQWKLKQCFRLWEMQTVLPVAQKIEINPKGMHLGKDPMNGGKK